MPAAFPSRVEDITPEWLTETLRAAGLLTGGAVVGLEREPIGEQGQAAEVFRLPLRFEGGQGDAPSSLVAKVPPPIPEVRAQMHALGLFECETRFYQHFAADAGISVPACHFAEVDLETGEFLLLLEDMSDCRVGDVWQGDPDDVRMAVDALAGLHARWWCSPELREHAWLRQHDDVDYNQTLLAATLRAVLPLVEERFAARFAGYLRDVSHQLAAGWEAMIAYRPGDPFTLVHQDYHPKQLFFPSERGGRFAVFDWQSAAAGYPATDLARIIASGLRPAQAQALRPELTRRYQEQLAARGIEYGGAELERDLQRGMLITLFITIFAMGTSDTSIMEKAARDRGIDYLDRIFGDLAEVLESFRVHELLG